MTELEFFPYHNRLCKFTLENGQELGGVIVANQKTATKYVLIKNYNLIAYKNAEQMGDINMCKSLSEGFDIKVIKKALILL